MQVLSRCFAGFTSAAAAAVEISAAIAISVVATNLFRMCTIMVSDCVDVGLFATRNDFVTRPPSQPAAGGSLAREAAPLLGDNSVM
ncbi:hypothetical protein BSN85_05855 [Bradyrhizobium brasilense]|nr:hypothetical protein BSN85_05855 [Bradyrhizobium brasilense]